MFFFGKNEFSEELRVVEKINDVNKLEKKNLTDEYYLTAESDPNIYENLEFLNESIKKEFIREFNQEFNQPPIEINTEFIKNKLNKRSIFKQNLEKFSSKLTKIKNLFFGIFENNETYDLATSCFSIEINSSNELLSIFINHNLLMIYNLITGQSIFYIYLGCIPFNMKLPHDLIEYSKVKKFSWSKIKPNEFSVIYNDYIAYFEYTNNHIFLSNLKKFDNIINSKVDYNGM